MLQVTYSLVVSVPLRMNLTGRSSCHCLHLILGGSSRWASCSPPGPPCKVHAGALSLPSDRIHWEACLFSPSFDTSEHTNLRAQHGFARAVARRLPSERIERQNPLAVQRGRATCVHAAVTGCLVEASLCRALLSQRSPW